MRSPLAPASENVYDILRQLARYSRENLRQASISLNELAREKQVFKIVLTSQPRGSIPQRSGIPRIWSSSIRCSFAPRLNPRSLRSNAARCELRSKKIPAALWTLEVAKLRLSQRPSQMVSRQKRDLPWRQTRDPYRIWISEIMLQQTRVAAVIPYYERFLRRFPMDMHWRARESKGAEILVGARILQPRAEFA